MLLSDLLKQKREKKKLLMREVAALVNVDTAIISKIEKGDRIPTKEQIEKLAVALDIDHKKLLTLWLSEKIYKDVQKESVAIDAIKLALKRIKNN